MSGYTYSPLPQVESEIRLLVIHAGTGHDEINLEMGPTYNLNSSQPAPYEALSYVWGSEENKICVKISPDGRGRFFVTRNLADALLHLRYTDAPRIMWIDAICINQNDNEEKSFQVAMMGKIYEQAQRVIAWLGPGTEDSTRALDIIEEIGSQLDVDWGTSTVSASGASTNPDIAALDMPLPYTLPEARSVGKIFSRPWFERLWIRQEVGLGQVVMAQVGDRVIRWEHLQKALWCIHSKRVGAEAWTGDAEDSLVLNVCKSGRRYRLSRLRQDTKFSRCLDPRDRIYAVLSLLDKHDSALGIVPDYSGSPGSAAEIYRDCVLKYIEATNNLDIMSSCQYAGENHDRLLGLNTWVPDWSTDFSGHLLQFMDGGLSKFACRAEYLGEGVLRVAGFECGTVSQTQKMDVTNLVSLAQDVKKFATTVILESEKSGTLYPTGEIMLDAFGRIMCSNIFGDRFSPPFSAKLGFDEVRQKIQTLLEMRTIGSEEELDASGLGWYTGMWSDIYKRPFLTTENGLMGHGPLGSRPGDILVLFLGSTDVTVLRDLPNSQYQVIGQCYLHGVMCGEPLLGSLPENVRLIKKLSSNRGFKGYETCYEDTVTGQTGLEDPRLETSGFDLEKYREAWSRGEDVRVHFNRELFRGSAIDVREYDLV